MTSEEIRQSFLDFFEKKGHTVIPSFSLIPENDPTVLFTTAGMHPLVPYLMGEKHPAGQRLANCQKCIRTGDIDDVGDNRHLTFFEMLGNWSLGDPEKPNGNGASYFKKEAIEWSWEFLTSKEWLGLDPKRLYVTVFKGNDEISIDQESIDIWQKCFAQYGITAEVCLYNALVAGNSNFRIFPLPAKDNWWGPAGETGPCGPCTEMFYDIEPEKDALQKTFDEEVNNFRIMEFWNDVFMEFNKTAGAKFERLVQQNVDTGMGVERMVVVLNGKKDVFDTELFYPLFEKIEELSGKKYGELPKITQAMRIIADHVKAVTFILGDEKGITPSNIGAGYVLRRLIRRAVRNGFSLGVKETLTSKIAEEVIGIYQNIYPELGENKNFIISQLIKEEEKFGKTLEKGIKEVERIVKEKEKRSDDYINLISGKEAFYLYQTFGFPPEQLREELANYGMGYHKEEFDEELKKHQELSRTASAGMFKGGLVDASEQTTKYHTAAHLMLAALRKVLGKGVLQKGSNITSERLRFDFSYPEKMTPEQIKQVEDLVNEKIKEDLSVICEEMNLEDAKNHGAMGVFDQKYGERVKIYTIGNPATGDFFSKEICGGPHVNRTSEIGKFKILKEEASSAGIRRIRAIIEF